MSIDCMGVSGLKGSGGNRPRRGISKRPSVGLVSIPVIMSSRDGTGLFAPWMWAPEFVAGVAHRSSKGGEDGPEA